MRDKILQIFKNFETEVFTEDGLESIRVKGSGLYIVYICPDELMVGLWRGDEELDNSTCPTDSLLIAWCHQTAKEIR